MKIKHILPAIGLLVSCGKNPKTKLSSELEKIQSVLVDTFSAPETKEERKRSVFEEDDKTVESLDSFVQDAEISLLEDTIHKVKNQVYITIDDGPSKYTQEIIDSLESLGHKATFFRIGGNIREHHKELLYALIARGNDIGNHSFSHKQFGTLNFEQAQEELEKTDDQIEALMGKRSSFFRYPYGQEVKPELRDQFTRYLEQSGYKEHVFRTIDTKDRAPGTSRGELIKSLSDIKGGDIILIHERSRTAPETLILIDSILDAKNLISAKLSDHPKYLYGKTPH